MTLQPTLHHAFSLGHAFAALVELAQKMAVTSGISPLVAWHA